MNQNTLTTVFTEATMTLKEITDLLGVRHDKAMLKVAAMAESPDFGTMSILDIVYNDKGQTTKTYQLNKHQSIAAAAILNTTLLMRIIDRWQELEKAKQQLLPQTHIQAVEAYLVTLKKVEEQQKELGMQQLQISEDAILTEKSPEYYTVKQLRSLVPKPSGVVLSRVSAAMSYEVKSVYSQYDKMASNQYHKDVVNAVYGTDL